jgi:hypothetical protein
MAAIVAAQPSGVTRARGKWRSGILPERATDERDRFREPLGHQPRVPPQHPPPEKPLEV